MKGSCVVALSSQLKKFVSGLDELARAKFPVQDVLEYLKKGLLQPNDLEPYVFFSAQRYTRNLLYRQQEYELLLLCWMPGQASPIHGHEGEKCWMRVEQGSLHFTDYTSRKEGDTVVVEQKYSIEGGRGFVDGPAVIHRVINQGDVPAISLHLYARPFAQCDIFDHEKNITKRVELSYHSVEGKLVNLH